MALLVLTVHPAQAQQFGGVVALAGDQVVASHSGTTAVPGVVVVYSRTGDGTWAESARLRASTADGSEDGFGQAVASDGETLVVGAPVEGAVYVFTKDASGAWMQQQRLTAAAGAFGRAVSVQDHMLVVGADNEAHGFHRTDSGQWVSVGPLQPEETGTGRPDAITGDTRFGAAVSVEGMRALVGAPAAGSGAGQAFAFRFADGAWHAAGTLDMPASGEQAAVGSAVLVHHGYALVGAPGYAGRTGAVGVFSWDADRSRYDFERRLAPPVASGNEAFGASIAYARHAFYVGAPTTARAAGAVHVFRTSNHMQDWVHGGTLPADLQERNLLGVQVAVAGNVAVVGAPLYDNGEGAAVIYDASDEGVWSQSAVVWPEMEGGYASITGSGMRTCEDGAVDVWGCEGVDMMSFLTVADIGGARGTRTNDIWGWTDPETGREYALVGRTDGMAFVDVTDPYNPVYLGNMARTEGAPPSVWRDMKVYKDHVYVVADGAGEHGMQVFDLARLRNVPNPPVEFEPDVLYDGIASSHNIVINEETGFAYAVGNRMGGETCGGGLHMIDINDPKNPTFAGCFAHEGTGRSGTGTTHDAQCVVYRGPDADHADKEICLGSNETALSIADVTDKSAPAVISVATYPSIAYTHQGWLTEDQRFFFINDEGDEPQGLVEGTRTLIFDLQDLDDPILVGEHISTEKNTDHNLYVRGNLMYQSNYQSGLRIFDVSDPEAPVEIAYFDTVPNDATGGGSWSNYPYFESGTIVVTSGREGLFMLKKREVDL
jgi:choice-of-anchor B domain-containing protein